MDDPVSISLESNTISEVESLIDRIISNFNHNLSDKNSGNIREPQYSPDLRGEIS